MAVSIMIMLINTTLHFLIAMMVPRVLQKRTVGGDFWSFGAGWRISEEAFMKDVKWVNNLKLRASYGETGNDNILDSDGDPDYYPYQTLYGLGI